MPINLILLYVTYAFPLATELGLETDFPEKRKIKRKRMVSELVEDKSHSLISD